MALAGGHSTPRRRQRRGGAGVAPAAIPCLGRRRPLNPAGANLPLCHRAVRGSRSDPEAACAAAGHWPAV
jgi:hypothetical protein